RDGFRDSLYSDAQVTSRCTTMTLRSVVLRSGAWVLRRPASRAVIERSTLSMPFKSQAQRRKFAELLVRGKISPETFEEWNRETGGKNLPERVKSRRRTTKKK